jgi:hypothetical protein
LGAREEPAWERRRPAGKSRKKNVRNTPARRRRSQWQCPRGNFNVWEFPQMRVHDSGRPPADKKSSVSLDDERDKSPRRCGFALAKIWQLFNLIFAESDTEFFHWTNPALWISRRANQRAKFHE